MLPAVPSLKNVFTLFLVLTSAASSQSSWETLDQEWQMFSASAEQEFPGLFTSNNCEWQSGPMYDYGDPFVGGSGDPLYTCKLICHRDVNCWQYTYDSSAQHCHMKTSKQGSSPIQLRRTAPSQGLNCGYMQRGTWQSISEVHFYSNPNEQFPAVHWSPNCDWPIGANYDYASLEASSVDDCARECLQSAECRMFTFQLYGGYCFLKKIGDSFGMQLIGRNPAFSFTCGYVEKDSPWMQIQEGTFFQQSEQHPGVFWSSSCDWQSDFDVATGNIFGTDSCIQHHSGSCYAPNDGGSVYDNIQSPSDSSSWSDCSQQCIDVDACAYFTFSGTLKKCFLKSMGRYGDSRNNILVKRTAPSSYDFSCGYVVRDQHWHSLSDTFDEYVNFWRSFDDESSAHWNPNCDWRFDTDVDFYNQSNVFSLEECTRLCRKNSNCIQFTYSNLYKRCWLKQPGRFDVPHRFTSPMDMTSCGFIDKKIYKLSVSSSATDKLVVVDQSCTVQDMLKEAFSNCEGSDLYDCDTTVQCPKLSLTLQTSWNGDKSDNMNSLTSSYTQMTEMLVAASYQLGMLPICDMWLCSQLHNQSIQVNSCNVYSPKEMEVVYATTTGVRIGAAHFTLSVVPSRDGMCDQVKKVWEMLSGIVGVVGIVAPESGAEVVAGGMDIVSKFIDCS